MSASNLHLGWSTLLARSLARAGVRHAVVSPGSRSTPLVLGLLAERSIRMHPVIDERSAGFYALSIARVTGVPALLVCTSGTAVAHYLPALIEASLARVPLLALTADRPWDAYDCAAPQTIDQVKLFGAHVRHSAELGLPDGDALDALVRVATQCVLRTLGPDPGPVHLNARFRKPLEPQTVASPEPWEPAVERLRHAIGPRIHRPVADAFDLGVIEPFALETRSRVMVALGPALGPDRAEQVPEVLSLCAELSVPVLAEASSDGRFRAPREGTVSERARHGEPLILRAVDALVSSRRWRAEGPAMVIELGAPMVSSAYGQWVVARASDRDAPPLERVVFTSRGHNDPWGTATHLIDAEPLPWLRAWAAYEREALAFPGTRWERPESAVTEARAVREARAAWARGWAEADRRAQGPAREGLEEDCMTEGHAIAALHRSLPEGSRLLVGNSSAVRDIDAFALDPEPRVRVLHQRGASGIDGLIAGAAGARAVSKTPVAVLLGDVSLWHDVGSLQLLCEAREPVLVLVLQNRGGRIFDRLPLAQRREHRAAYERFFLTDRGVSFEGVTRGFGLAYERVEARSALAPALDRALRTPGATVLECVCVDGSAARFAAAVRAGAAAVDGP